MSLADRAERLAALRRFAAAITLLTVAGHTLLGFEQSWAQPLVGVLAACATEVVLEWVGARADGRPSRFAGGVSAWFDGLLSAHISGLAVAMLLYANDRLLPIAFAAASAVASKTLVRVPAAAGTRHFFNPSNFGISLTLIALPWVAIAPPYMFAENLSGAGDWILVGVLVLAGSYLNGRYTGRLPLIAAWLGGFALQAELRSVAFGTPLAAGLAPLTGVAFLLFTFYMITDPATSPGSVRGQVLFGASVAAAYGLLMALHIVFGLFFALTFACASRGLYLALQELRSRRALPARLANEWSGVAAPKPSPLGE